MLVWRRWIFPLLMLVVCAVAAAALGKLAFFPDEADAVVVPTGTVSDPTIVAGRGDVVNALSLQGTVARDAPATVRAAVDGTVTAVKATEGQSVAAGDVLFTMKQTEPARSVSVTAPEAGTVSEIAVVAGQPVSIGGELTTFTPARYHVLSTVEPAQLYRLLEAPTEASVTIAGGPAPFTCTGLTVQVSDDGTTSVRCAVPADQRVFAGLVATVDVTISTVTDALVVPTTAVKGGAGTGTVYVVPDDGGEPEERAVTLGVNDGTVVEVTSGLTEGESIRQFVPGSAAVVEPVCFDDGMGNQICQTGSTW